MTDSEIIRKTIKALVSLGYMPKCTKKEISQNQGSKLIGRGTLKSAMEEGYNKTEYVPGVVRWTKKDMNSDHCPVRVNKEDIYKLLNR